MDERLITELPNAPDIVVLQPIPVTFQFDEDGDVLSTFAEAGMWYGGEDVDDAFESMRELVAISFRLLSGHPDNKLGPKMKKEKDVLLRYLAWAPTC